MELTCCYELKTKSRKISKLVFILQNVAKWSTVHETKQQKTVERNPGLSFVLSNVAVLSSSNRSSKVCRKNSRKCEVCSVLLGRRMSLSARSPDYMQSSLNPGHSKEQKSEGLHLFLNGGTHLLHQANDWVSYLHHKCETEGPQAKCGHQRFKEELDTCFTSLISSWTCLVPTKTF